MNYIKSPIFYMGNKYDLLEQLIPLFPKNINTFYDLFGGSGVMTLNVFAYIYIYNELNDNIYNLFKMFKEHSSQEIIDRIKYNIKKYNLNEEGTDVRQNEPDILEIREYYNKKYLNFRREYNKQKERNILDLFTLTFYSFSNLIRFNSKNQFNMPYGNRCFCKFHADMIKVWCDYVHKRNIKICNENAFDILKETNFNENDFIYLDPPYSNTLAIYNEKRAFGGWTIKNDLELFQILEELDKKNIKWGLSNVFENKETKNQHLIDWCNKNNWYVFHLDKNYASLGKGNANSDEVYITNYSSGNNKIQTTIFDFIDK